MLTIDYKICTKCNKLKSDNEFYKETRSKDGFNSWCKFCRQKDQQKYQMTEKGKISGHNGNLKYKFGITEEDYNELFDKQNGCCAICGINQDKLKRKLAVDHNHKTRKVRSLLCSHCNIGLGHFKEDINILKLSIIYLDNHKEEQTNVFLPLL